jgi:hypothetical protein
MPLFDNAFAIAVQVAFGSPAYCSEESHKWLEFLRNRAPQ